MENTKRYTTTISTTWDIRGENVTPEQINARIQSALSILMMTNENDWGGYAFMGGSQRFDLTCETKEVNVDVLSNAAIDESLKEGGN